jgi:hypothetical protein
LCPTPTAERERERQRQRERMAKKKSVCHRSTLVDHSTYSPNIESLNAIIGSRKRKWQRTEIIVSP